MTLLQHTNAKTFGWHLSGVDNFLNSMFPHNAVTPLPIYLVAHNKYLFTGIYDPRTKPPQK